MGDPRDPRREGEIPADGEPTIEAPSDPSTGQPDPGTCDGDPPDPHGPPTRLPVESRRIGAGPDTSTRHHLGPDATGRGWEAGWPAERLGRYVLKGRIAEGGMGDVYRAHDPELNRDLAIKVM